MFLPAVAAFSLFVCEAADLHACEIVFQVIVEERFNGRISGSLDSLSQAECNRPFSSHDLLGDISFWHPIASIVTIAPFTSTKPKTSG